MGILPRKGFVTAAAIAACAALGAGLAACGGDDPEPRQVEPLDLVIGDSVPLSGELAAYGPAGRKAAALALAQIRAAIRAGGAPHTVRLITHDNATNSATAATGARQMVKEGGATCLTGAWASADTLEIADSVAVPERVLQISPASTAEEITGFDDDGQLMRTAPSDALEGRALAQAASDALGGAEGRTAHVGARDDDYGDGVSSAFSDSWREADGIITEDVSYEPEPEADGPGYDEVAEQLTEGSPDAILIADFPETFAQLAPQLVATGSWDPARAWATSALSSPALSAQTGAAAIEGMRGTLPSTPRREPVSVAFDRLFARARPASVDRGLFDAQQFDAVILCYLAAVGAASTDGEEMADALIDLTAPQGAEYSWRQLPEAIAALSRGEDIDYTGASGPIDMDENGDPTAATFDLYRHSRGRVKVIGQVRVEGD